MQIKAIRQKLRIVEVPVSYRNRIGVSKISGNLKASVLAGIKILWTVFRYRVQP
jgi:predicted deacetylase